MDNQAELAIIIAPNNLPHLYRLDQLEALIAEFSEREASRQALDLTIDIEDIRRRYETEKSFFSKLAEQYVSLQWWMKLVLGVLVIGIGCILNISIWVSIVCYIGLSLLFFEHNQKNDAYQTRVFEDVCQLKMQLASTIQHTDAIKLSLFQIMQNLNTLNIELAQSHAIHQAQIQEMNFQIDNSKTIIRNLTHTTQTLTLNLSSHQDELDKAYKLVSNHEQILEQQAKALEDINRNLSAEIAAIRAKKVELEEKCVELSNILDTHFTPMRQAEDDTTISRAQAALRDSEQINATVQQLIHSTRVKNNLAI